jgi:hypothetical protein
MLVLLVGNVTKKLFLGSLSRDEVEQLLQNSKHAIIETALALTIFREELNLKLLGLFVALLFFKIFHWLAAMRVENFGRATGIHALTHVRIIALLGFLATVDVVVVVAIGAHLLEKREASVLLLFAFEFTILCVTVASTVLKFALIAVDVRMEGRWAGKSACLFYVEFGADFLRLMLYLAFFLIVWYVSRVHFTLFLFTFCLFITPHSCSTRFLPHCVVRIARALHVEVHTLFTLLLFNCTFSLLILLIAILQRLLRPPFPFNTRAVRHRVHFISRFILLHYFILQCVLWSPFPFNTRAVRHRVHSARSRRALHSIPQVDWYVVQL